MKHADLIARLEAATGPNYALDVDVALATDYWPQDRIKNISSSFDGAYTVWFTDGPDLPLAPNVTASIDAAKAFTMKLLPGWRYAIERRTNGTCLAWVTEEDDAPVIPATHQEDAIALLIAALKAHGASHDA